MNFFTIDMGSTGCLVVRERFLRNAWELKPVCVELSLEKRKKNDQMKTGKTIIRSLVQKHIRLTYKKIAVSTQDHSKKSQEYHPTIQVSYIRKLVFMK